MIKYNLTEKEMKSLIPYFKGFIYEIETENIEIDLSWLNLSPNNIVDILRELGYTKEDWDTNGWDQDTWIYMFKPEKPTLCLYYCGYGGQMNLHLLDNE